jgi:hypothetical protein
MEPIAIAACSLSSLSVSLRTVPGRDPEPRSRPSTASARRTLAAFRVRGVPEARRSN